MTVTIYNPPWKKGTHMQITFEDLPTNLQPGIYDLSILVYFRAPGHTVYSVRSCKQTGGVRSKTVAAYQTEEDQIIEAAEKVTASLPKANSYKPQWVRFSELYDRIPEVAEMWPPTAPPTARTNWFSRAARANKIKTKQTDHGRSRLYNVASVRTAVKAALKAKYDTGTKSS
jgi:hypothetical protein